MFTGVKVIALYLVNLSSIQNIKYKIFLLNLVHFFLIRGNQKQLVLEKYTPYLCKEHLNTKNRNCIYFP